MKAKAIVGVAILAGLVGCTTSGRKVSQTQVETIHVGDTKQDVQTLIGPPDQITRNMSDEKWVYSYKRSSPNSKRFIPLLGTFIGGKNVETQQITVMFDQNGRVADVETAYGGTDAKGRPITTSSESATSTTTTTPTP